MMERGARRKRVDSEVAVGVRAPRRIGAVSPVPALPSEAPRPASDTPAARRRAWRERSMDRVFDEYLRYLRESPSEEDSAARGRAPERKPEAGAAGRVLKKYRRATSKGKRREAEDLDAEEE